ncbi:MAG: ribonuclease H-like domain-containing protein [Lachnospiraceae bacterium]|nr:ribonuclease H-like domain-containing protein [Lachnospiraceae bacterium]
MIVIKNKARDNKYIQLDKHFDTDDIVLFDIETTGFAAQATTLYLIGCACYENDDLIITQWFNDDGKSEVELINSFFKYTSNYKTLIHYNGDGFDIPYIDKKLCEHKLSYSFDNLESFDLYKHIRPYKDMLHLDNLKQKSVEKFLGINRLDKYSGGDLIRIYKEYLEKPDDKKEQLLLQHNYEDIEGLIYNCCLLSYIKLNDGNFEVKSMSVRKNKLLFSLALSYEIPKRISYNIHRITITGYRYEATITVPIIEDTLKFFFTDYKDYYYLPVEDRAIHKSVATYVDKDYRKKATKETCYVKQSGYFITQLDGDIITGYKRAYDDKESFIELNDSFLQDMDKINEYAKFILKKNDIAE